MKAAIVYHTKTGHTERAAEDIAAGLRDAGVDAQLIHASDLDDGHLADAAIVVVGSPCHAGSCRLRGGLSGPVRALLKRLGKGSLAGKVGGAFAVNYAYGGHVTVGAIEKALRGAGARVPAPGVVVKAGVPLSLYEGPKASPDAREALRQLGQALAAAIEAG
ncbi:MAG: flavodoxin domain-containing protein [Candidatus Brocadiae bacterium]|nr:flavodoxin domain-containing protein [Candidatus Brocadiia bacterium]